MKRLVLVIATLVACHDDHPTLEPDAPVDTPPPAATLTSYVVDLITAHTDETSTPRAYAEFSTLPDPDGDADNLAAYTSLFQ